MIDRPPLGRPGPGQPPDGLGQLPSARRLALLGALFVLVPGIGLFVVLRLVGLSTSIAGIAGLFAMVAGMGAFPAYLRRLPTPPDPT